MRNRSAYKHHLMKQSAVVILLVLMILTAAACNKDGGAEYYTGDTPVGGGSVTESQAISVSDIDISYFQEQSEIALHFAYTTYEETQNESGLISLPKYEITLLEEPYRLAISLTDVDRVNYVEKSTWGLGEHVTGLFRSRISGSDVTTIYFELTGPVKFLVDEGDNTLRVLLQGEDSTASNSHFVMVNAFDEYLSGGIDDSLGLKPVLCADGVNVGLISDAYATADMAETARTALEAQLAAMGIAKMPYTLTLAGEAMPVYNTDIDENDAEANAEALAGNRAENLPVKLADGKLIAQNSSADIYVLRQKSDDGTYYLDGETLWMVVNASGRLTDLALPVFTSVQQAAFSYDERYFGFIDVNVDTRVLYVYDFLSGQLFNLGEEDLGVNTASFCWAANEDAVFAVTGEESMRIAKCLFTDQSLMLSTVIGSVSGEGRLWDMGDTLLLANNAAGEHGIIYAFDKRTGEKTFLTEGVDFAVAPDEETMAVVEYVDYGEEVGYGNFKIYSFLDQSETMVVKGGIVESFAYLPSSTGIIYTDGSESDETYRYNHALNIYDMGTSTSQTLGYLKTGAFILSQDARSLSLIGDYMGSDGRYHYTTYAMNWKDYQ